MKYFGTKVNHPDKMMTPNEVSATLLALAKIIEEMEDAPKITNANFNAEAKRSVLEILTNARSAKKKLENLTTSGKSYDLPKYERGDERDFIEKYDDAGTPKLKRLVAEIKDILVEEDVAGIVILHTPGFSEYLNYFMPSYSCMIFEENAIRFRCRLKEDCNGDRELQQQKMSDTVNMLTHFRDVGGMVLMPVLDLLKQLEEKEGLEIIKDPEPIHTVHLEPTEKKEDETSL